MKRMNDHLTGGSPSDVQETVVRVRESLVHALTFIKQHQQDAEIHPEPGVDGSYLQDAKENIIEALRDLFAVEAYAEGVAAYNQDKPQSYKAAVEKLELALKYDTSGGHVPALRYYLGVTYYKLQRFRNATKQLEALAQSSRSADLLDGRALFHLAHAHDLLKQERRARKYYRKYLKKFPKGPHAGLVRQKLKQLPRSRR